MTILDETVRRLARYVPAQARPALRRYWRAFRRQQVRFVESNSVRSVRRRVLAALPEAVKQQLRLLRRRSQPEPQPQSLPQSSLPQSGVIEDSLDMRAVKLAAELISAAGPLPQDEALSDEAFVLIEKAFALNPTPFLATRLAAHFLQNKRPEDVSTIYRRAFRGNPHDVDFSLAIWTYILRYGTQEEIDEYRVALRHVRPDDEFLKFVDCWYASFERDVAFLVEGAGIASVAIPVFMGCTVWGRKYVDDFLRLPMASLLSSGNLPAVADRYRFHLVVMTTEEDWLYLCDHPLGRRVRETIAVHFLRMDEAAIAAVRSNHPTISITAKIMLNHLVQHCLLEVARQTQGYALAFGGDNLFNDVFLPNLLQRAKEGYKAVCVAGLRLHSDEVGPTIEKHFRRDDDTVAIDSASFCGLVRDYLPQAFCVDSKFFGEFPLFLAWRVDDEGMIIHCNHFMPYLVKGNGFTRPLRLRAEPIDGFIMQDHDFKTDEIFLATTSDMMAIDLGSNPYVCYGRPGSKVFDEERVARWLLAFWQRFTRHYFSAQIRYPTTDNPSTAWDVVGHIAAKTAEGILDHTSALFDAKRRNDGWTTPANPDR